MAGGSVCPEGTGLRDGRYLFAMIVRPRAPKPNDVVGCEDR